MKHASEQRGGTDWDETFAFIAGHTEGGLPLGVAWEELSPAPAFPSERRRPPF